MMIICLFSTNKSLTVQVHNTNNFEDKYVCRNVDRYCLFEFIVVNTKDGKMQCANIAPVSRLLYVIVRPRGSLNDS